MAKTQIVINVSGGLVQDVFCSDPDTQVALVDWDTETCDPADDDIVAVNTADGHARFAHVAEYAAHPFSSLFGTDVATAMDTAGIRFGQA